MSNHKLQFTIESLGLFARFGASIFFTAIQDLVIAKIADQERRDVAAALVGKAREIVGLLTDSDKENEAQLRTRFAANWRDLVATLAKLVRLLMEANDSVPEWVRGLLVKLENFKG